MISIMVDKNKLIDMILNQVWDEIPYSYTEQEQFAIQYVRDKVNSGYFSDHEFDYFNFIDEIVEQMKEMDYM